MALGLEGSSLSFVETPQCVAGPFAAFARRLELPQTASLALAGPLLVPETGGGHAWHDAFDASGDLLPVSA